MQKSVLICLFRNDLRLHDHPGLTAAFHSKATHVLPLYVFDPVFMDLSNVPFVSFPAPLTWHYQFPRCHVHRSRFIFESVMDLKRSLKKKGSDLLIQFGPPEFVVESLVKQLKANEYDILGIHMSKEVIMRLIDLPKYTYEEELTEKRLLTLNVPIQFFHSSTMINLDRLPFSIDHLPNVYTQFRTEIEKTRDSIIPAALPVPSEWKPIPSESECILDSAVYGPGFSISLNTLKPAFGLDKSRDSRSAFPFQGGETAGKNRVKHYFFQTDLVKNYFNVRNGLCGVDYSTKFSPWLANGCLSARYILEELKKYEEERGNNKSTYWVWFELLWRDYFKLVAMKFGTRLFMETGLQASLKFPWINSPKAINAWTQGQTGIPFVDANMKELLLTGFMSNRGRQNVASFLTKDLKVDWRLGAEWFESLLVDHDPASNYGNWLYIAGLGNDPREDRHFNIIKQAYDYDKEGQFVKTWLEPLKQAIAPAIHSPWKWSKEDQAKYQCILSKEYPGPILLVPQWENILKKRK